MRVLPPAVAAAVWLLLSGSPVSALEHTDPFTTGLAIAAEAQEQPGAEEVPSQPVAAVAIDPPKVGGVAARPAEPPAALAPPLAPPPPPAVTLLLKANLKAQNVTVIADGRVLGVWPISSGRAGYATPTGTYRPAWMAKMWRSRQYDDAPMPHSVFFNKGIAFHATSAVSMLGRPASHGCLRLAPAHAAQLYALVRRHGLLHTKVVVEGTAVFRAPAMARRAPPARPREVTVRPRREGRPVAQAQWLLAQ